jgi:hypothetical protein
MANNCWHMNVPIKLLNFANDSEDEGLIKRQSYDNYFYEQGASRRTLCRVIENKECFLNFE